MTANPLMNGKSSFKKSPREIVDEGNARLAANGRRDIHWVLRDDHPHLEWATAPVGSGLGR